MPADTDAYVAGLVESVLLTAPGERVNRPDFGAGLGLLLFAPVDAATVATAELQARSALQLWLADVIEVGEVAIDLDGSIVRVSVAYTALAGGRAGSLTLEWSA